ncbi:neurofilament heavy polypeptide isoform X2 [Drosophila montana]|uniref:neurofilament heavy polypeptide isoform X2 n=1 Tax=Drosophila montana TaxID=40370 RepID=UPI00313BE653
MLNNIRSTLEHFERNEDKRRLNCVQEFVVKKIMEISTATQIDGVLLPQESAPAGATNTPVAKKTRRAVQKKLNEQKLDNDSVLEDDVFMAAPKTPTAAIRLASETPRRSARKSVRPAMDYGDIVERHLMCSASKDKKDPTAVEQEEHEDQPVQKWTAAEVGRHSRKRNRKTKRVGNKKAKTEEESGDREEIKERAEQLEVTVTATAELAKADSVTEEAATADAAAAEAVTVPPQPKDNDATQSPVGINNKSLKATAAEIELALCPEIIGNAVAAAAAPIQEPDAAVKAHQAVRVRAVDMDELGLCPLDAEEPLTEDDEMPTLVVDDDDGEPENALNRTFDAEDQSSVDKDMPTLNIFKQKSDDKEPKQPDVDMRSPSSSKAYRFPTPFKCKSKPKFQFTTSPTAFPLTAQSNNNTNNLEVPPASRRKRSKSVSGLNETKAKTVSFFSPIEVTVVSEIDKRWDALNNSHVTQRRKRSKSLDESRHQVSRIPKPKQYPPIKAAVTPSKLKARTKLPNFAAIHQKHFEKMENLVEHIERKAVRAKVLTNSAVKQQQQTIASAQKSVVKKLAPAAERSRAFKKIDVPSYTLTPLKPEELKRQKQLPTPRKIVGVAQPKSVIPIRSALAGNNPKPAFNLSTAVAPKLFIPAPSAASGQNLKTGESKLNKLESRRQRHMEMFKGRNVVEKRGEFIRGVRSNRRFELQMQHRRQLDENTG